MACGNSNIYGRIIIKLTDGKTVGGIRKGEHFRFSIERAGRAFKDQGARAAIADDADEDVYEAVPVIDITGGERRHRAGQGDFFRQMYAAFAIACHHIKRAAGA